MNSKFKGVITSVRDFMLDHNPEILTGIGISGMITTTILAVRATPKALKLIEEGKKIYKSKDLTIIETVKVAWKPYIPAALMGTLSITCLIGSTAVSVKRNAALAMAYDISERTLIRYRDKVIETIGEKKEKDIRNQLAQEDVDNNQPNEKSIIITSKGNTLCKDSISGRYFMSDLDTIRKIINETNRKMTFENYISLNEFYYSLGLDPVKEGDNLGWNIVDGLIELDISACVTKNDEPCIVVDYSIAPRPNYDR